MTDLVMRKNTNPVVWKFLVLNPIKASRQICSWLMDSAAFEEWKSEQTYLVRVTTDNEANIAAAVRQLGCPWLNCFGHNLNIAVKTSQNIASMKSHTVFWCRFFM